MTDEALSPDELEVLRLVDKKGIEAHLTEEQYRLRDDLAMRGLVYRSGDEYDYDLFLTEDGRLVLAMQDPAWWNRQYLDRRGALRQAEYMLNRELPERFYRCIQTLNRQIAQLEAQRAKVIEDQELLLKVWAEKVNVRKAELDIWLAENKSKLGAAQ